MQKSFHINVLTRYIIIGTILLITGIHPCLSAEEHADTGNYLDVARMLVAKVKPENNMYVNSSKIDFDGGFFTKDYITYTDCSGFVGSVLEKSGNKTYDIVKGHAIKLGRADYPEARDYYNSIIHGWGFKNIDGNVSDILPGDIMAFVYPVGTSNYTGHVMIVDEKPIEREATPPIVEDTTQWAVTILDSSNGHWKPDTRYREKGEQRQTGIGRGIVRLYSDAAGKIVGYAWSLSDAAKYKPVSLVPVAVGRPVAGND
jgi:hypothetical protein